MNSIFPYALFTAWRYLRGSQQETSINSMIKICFFSLLIGTCALTLVTSIMDGFAKATYERLQSIHAHLTLESPHEALNVPKIIAVLKNEFPQIVAYSPTSMQHGMAQSPYDNNDTEIISHIVALKSINPEEEARTSTLESKIIEGLNGTKLIDIVHDNHVLMGEKCAAQLRVIPGDSFTIWYIPQEHQGQKNIALESSKAIVGGIFKIGIEEYDASVLFCTQSFLQSMFTHSHITTINLKLAPQASENHVIALLRERFPFTIYSWKDLYPALVAALRLEKYATLIFLSLLLVVATMNIMAVLFMYIHQKRVDIAILKAMGAENTTIKAIFLCIGMIISLIASTLGLLLALALGILLKQYPLLELPDMYYATHLPISLHWYNFAAIFVLVQCLSFFATLIALRKTHEIHISDVLRFQG